MVYAGIGQHEGEQEATIVPPNKFATKPGRKLRPGPLGGVPRYRSARG
jgi:hypothetical protein